MAEQALCKRQVVSPTLTDGSIDYRPRYQSGQLELTVNQLALRLRGFESLSRHQSKHLKSKDIQK